MMFVIMSHWSDSTLVAYAYLSPFAGEIVRTVNRLRRGNDSDLEICEDESRFTTIWA